MPTPSPPGRREKRRKNGARTGLAPTSNKRLAKKSKIYWALKDLRPALFERFNSTRIRKTATARME